MRIGYFNRVDTAVVSATTAITNYPETKTQTERLSETFRSSTLSNLIIKVVLSSAQTVTMAGIAGHNLTSSATVVFSCTYSEPILYSEQTMVRFYSSAVYNDNLITEAGDNLTTEAGDQLITGTSNTTIQTCYFEINDPTNPDGFIEIGRLWVGEYIDISPASLANFSIIKKNSDIVMHTKGRQKFAITKSNWRQFNLEFPLTNYIMIKKIEDMYDYCGNYKSIIFCNFDDVRGYILVEPCYCSVNGEIGFKHNESMQFNYSLQLEEEL